MVRTRAISLPLVSNIGALHKQAVRLYGDVGRLHGKVKATHRYVDHLHRKIEGTLARIGVFRSQNRVQRPRESRPVSTGR